MRLSIAFFWKGNHTEKGWFNNKKMNAYESGKAYAAQLCQLKPESIDRVENLPQQNCTDFLGIENSKKKMNTKLIKIGNNRHINHMFQNIL